VQRRWRRWNAPLLAALCATGLCAWLYWFHQAGRMEVPLARQVELASIDARFKLRGKREPKDDRIAIVGFDEKTRSEVPRLFQQRGEWARFIEALAEYQPDAIGIDALFSSPEINLPLPVVRQVRKAIQELDAGAPAAPELDRARRALEAVAAAVRGDELLAEAVARAKNVYVGLLFFLEDGERSPLPDGAEEPAAVAPARYGESASVAQPHARRPPRAQASLAASLPGLVRGAAGAGALNLVVDSDSNTRRMYAVIEHGGRYYMPLGLAVAARTLPPSATTGYVTGEPVIRFGRRKLPVDPRGIAQLAFLGPAQSISHYSAVDVLHRRVPRSALAGKLVFVGRTDKATDTFATPFDPLMPGVEIHATAAHNLLHDELLRSATPLTTLLTIFGLGLLLSALQLRLIRHQRAWLVGMAGLVLVVVYAGVAEYMFSGRDLILEVAAPIASCVLVTLSALTVNVATEGREKAELRAVFSQYVPKMVVERILSEPERARLGGVRRDLTVLFSDVRGFSRLSEGLEPERLSAMLNEYLTPMTELVMQDGGMLDKYIGDAVMAVYGAPLELHDHAGRACRTALAMHRALRPLNDDFRRRQLPEIAIGIGINSGPMAVGNMGSEARFDYTVLGDAVNLGARLEALTKEYKADVIVGEHTQLLARGAFVFRELDYVRVTGRDGTARIYELVGGNDQTRFRDEDLALFADALAEYRGGDWARAEKAFREFANRHPTDGPTHVFLARVEDLRARPNTGWDGVYEQRGK
jgi:adenylate cyclase